MQSTNKIYKYLIHQLFFKLCKQRLLLVNNGLNHNSMRNTRSITTNVDVNDVNNNINIINSNDSNISESDDSNDSDQCDYERVIERGVPKTVEEYEYRKRLRVNQPSMSRLARVVILGAPNAGKSTLTNQLVGHRISSVSSKVHTTSHSVKGVIVDDDTQVEFLDTPGLVTYKHCLKHNLAQTFLKDPLYCVEMADIIAVINDVSNAREREKLNPGIIQILEKHRSKESILILNKIDKIKEKRKLLDIITRLTCGVVGGVCSVITPKRHFAHHNTPKNLERIFTETERKLNEFDISNDDNSTDNEKEQIGWPQFANAFMVSATSGDGVQHLRKYLLSRAKFNRWLHHSSQVTDQHPQDLLKSTIREKCLDMLPQEIPYKINFHIDMWEVDRTGNLHVCITLLCESKYVSLILGPKGQTIAIIARTSREDLSDTFHCEVSLKLVVRAMRVKAITKTK